MTNKKKFNNLKNPLLGINSEYLAAMKASSEAISKMTKEYRNVPNIGKLLPDINHTSPGLSEGVGEMEIGNQLKIDAQQATIDSLEVLKEIRENTASLKMISDLMAENVDNQEEIKNLVMDILTISQSKSKEEADSKYRKVMSKINDLNSVVGSVENIIKLTAIANAMLTFFNK